MDADPALFAAADAAANTVAVSATIAEIEAETAQELAQLEGAVAELLAPDAVVREAVLQQHAATLAMTASKREAALLVDAHATTREVDELAVTARRVPAGELGQLCKRQKTARLPDARVPANVGSPLSPSREGVT